jgi:hypothetical protein
VIDASPSLLAIFVGTFGLALVAKLTSGGFLCARFVIFAGPMAAIRAEVPGVFALFAAISCGHVGGASVSYVSGLLKPSVICVELGPTSENFFSNCD